MLTAAQTAGEPAGDAVIDQALQECLTRAEADGISLQEAMDKLGPASFCFLCLLLAIPFLQPVPLGPYTMASGLTFMAAGWQMARGHGTPTLPARMRQCRLHGRGWVAALRLCQRLLGIFRKFTRPRLSTWVSGDQGTRQVGLLILTGGFLLTIPAANMPFNNTLPALMILCAAVAWIERDGLLIFAALFWGALTVGYFLTLGLALWFFGSHIFAWMKPWLPWQ